MHTLDVLRNGKELTIIVTGPAAAPTVVELATGAGVRLSPATVDTTPWWCTVGDAPNPMQANGWWGELPIGEDVITCRLWIDADGQHHRCTVQCPKLEPVPVPPTPAPRQGRKAA
jgi:hypothetical protein